MPDKNIIPIEALFGEAPELLVDPRDELADADAIVAVVGQREVLVYGREALQSIVDSDRPRSLQVMYVGLEQHELEKLCDLVRRVKGRCDYPV